MSRVTIKSGESIRAVLLDIEGTTTPIDFVYKVLFPFARNRIADFLSRHAGDQGVRTDLSTLRTENSADVAEGLGPPLVDDRAEIQSLVAYFEWLMDQDRKSTPLKSLQGKIWEEGYRLGELKGQVFDDVPEALERWTRLGRKIYIYSSGSVLAQKLLFGNTESGDLTAFLSGYFDTNTGPKLSSESYKRVASSIQLPTCEVVFFSDVTTELQAASDAGMQAVLCIRPGNRPVENSSFRSIHSFDAFTD